MFVENESILHEGIILGDYLLNVRTEPEYQIIQLLDNGDTDTVQFIPTYFESEIDWVEADILKLRDFISKTLAMQRVPPPLDPLDEGEIALTVESDFDEEPSGRVEARRRVKKAGCSLRRRTTTGGGRPEQDEEFVLVAYKETDDNGEVNFGFLPDGTYRLNIQYPGVPMDPNSFIQFEIDALGGQKGFELKATVEEDGIFVEKILGIRGTLFKDLNIYPNPASDHLTINYKKLRLPSAEMVMTDLQGKTVHKMFLYQGFNKEVRLELGEVPNGIYLLNFYDPNRTTTPVAVFRVIVQRKP